MNLKETIVCLSSAHELGFRDKAEFINLNKSKKDFSKGLAYPAGKKTIFDKYLNDQNYQTIAARLEKGSAKPVFFFEKSYPPLLKEIFDFPIVLYCRGNIDLLKESNTLAIVGSRKASSYGLNMTEKIATKLAASGVVIISGLALGVDGRAHQGALEASGKTIAVLGTSIDQIYPANHLPLAKRIMENNGLIISEYPPDYPFFKYNFPQRNRIIAGLSKATIVTEAAEKSGALITANLASEYGREVFAVPADVDRINSKGANTLIEQGASCLTSVDTLLEFFGANKVKPRESVQGTARLVVEELELGKIDFDGLVSKLQLPAQEASIVLLELEMKGLIKKDLEGLYLLV